MKKRFTDADKWDDPWFLKLGMPYKLLWIHLLDKCDQAGIYKVNEPMIEFCINVKFDINEMLKVFNGRIKVLSDEKWFIPKFITFQYGELNESCKPHKSVLNILKNEGIVINSFSTGNEKIKGYPKGIHTLKDKDKDKIKKKTRGGFIKPTIDEIALYCNERKNKINPQQFYDSNEAKGWVVGKTQTPIKDWKAVIRTWESKSVEFNKKEESIGCKRGHQPYVPPDWMKE